MTDRTPEERLREANASDTWRPPTPYSIEFAKKVENAAAKEKTLHQLLEQYTHRINPRREFFRTTAEEVRRFFDLMDGDMWSGAADDGALDTVNDLPDDIEAASAPETEPFVSRGCRDMSKCFAHGQRIRHTIGTNKTWFGTYDVTLKAVIVNDIPMSLNKLVTTHYQHERPDRTPRANAWQECEYEVDGRWVSTYNIIV